MADRQLRRRIRRELQELGIQPPLSVDELRMALAAQRGRPIVVQQKALPMPGPLGFWIDHKLADIIVVQERTTKLHQDHIVLHELCHLKADGADATPWESLVSGIDTDGGHQLFQRCSYDDNEECRVEKAATIIMEWASVLEQVGPPPTADPSVRRVNLALGDRQGWL
ncbi:hypothetical protein ABT246_07470 [Streptomyces sp. NPDC001553]|uniref:hypothetical protein n=1 Tax=Streptomyces sp. NPDC001553 TaxID=3154385 RepID=UPI00331B747F